MRCIRIFLSFLAIMYCAITWAQSATPDLFTAHVLVTSRSDDAKTAGFQDGLKQVYMKLAGIADVKSYEPLVKSLDKAPDWVDRFQYQQAGNETFMLIRYNEDLVKSTLKDAELAFSEEPRPRIVAWVSMQVQGTPILLTENQLSPEALAVRKALFDASARWSVPLEIPRGELPDLINPHNLQEASDDVMRDASAHYSTDGFIALTLTGQEPNWNVVWRTQVKDAKANGKVDGTLPVAFDNALLGVDDAWMHQPVPAGGTSDTGASDNAGAAMPSDEVLIIVSHVNDLESYMRIDAFLNTLPGVKSVDTEEMNIPSVTFRLSLKPPYGQWKAGLASEQVLALDSNVPDDAPPNTFYYHYVSP